MIKVVGVGHALGGDDFVGIKVVEELSEEVKKDGVEFITTMDPSRIVYLLEDASLMVVVDAVIGEKPGEVHLIDYEKYPKCLKPISSHGFEVTFAIEIAKRLGVDVKNKVKIVGITIKEIEPFSDRMSKEVLEAIPKAKELVRRLIGS